MNKWLLPALAISGLVIALIIRFSLQPHAATHAAERPVPNVHTFELCTVDSPEPALLGIGGEFVSSAGIIRLEAEDASDTACATFTAYQSTVLIVLTPVDNSVGREVTLRQVHADGTRGQHPHLHRIVPGAQHVLLTPHQRSVRIIRY